MKAHELLKSAVEEQDWIKVCKVYTAITGKPLSPPKKKVSLLELEIPEDLLEDIEATRNDDDEDEDEEYDDIPDSSVDDNYEENGEEEEDDEVPLIIDSPAEPEPVEVEVSKKKGGESEFSISHGVQGPKASSDGNGTIMTKVPIVKDGPRKNKFKDNLAVKAGDLKKNNPILKKIYGKGSTRATRELIDAPDTGKLYAVECSLCKKAGKVTAALARGYNKNPENNTYRCTECDTPSGRAKLARRERDLGVYDG